MKNIKINKRIKNFFKELLITLIVIIVIAFLISIYHVFIFLYSYFNIQEKDILIFVISIVIIPLIFIIVLFYIKNRKTVFKNIENEIFKIACFFLVKLKYQPDEIIKTLVKIFPKYSESKINRLYDKVKSKNFDSEKSLVFILKEKHKTRLYLAYLLLEISAIDSVLTIKEEKILFNIISKLKIQNNIFEAIKQSFVNKGLKEERKIIEEQNRQKLINQFSRFMLPYEAYRIMGVSPSATKQQLKKAYRTLAKKHHPDKFAGESEEIIKKAEEKFQELKEAYDVILKQKK